MADSKVSALTAITGANVDPAADVLYIVDTSTSTPKKIVPNELFAIVGISALLDISGAAGGQIKFPASQNASSNANTLDDYEEGTWTPTLTFSTPGNVAVAYTTQVGSYTKIGRVVNINCAILTSSFTHSTASGQQQINGLPFTSAATAGYVWTGALAWQGVTKANYSDAVTALTTGSTALFFYILGSGQNLDVIQVADVPTTATQYRYSSLFYHV